MFTVLLLIFPACPESTPEEAKKPAGEEKPTEISRVGQFRQRSSYVPAPFEPAGLASIGLFPVTVGHPTYLLIAPLFERVTLDWDDGASFSIFARNLSERNLFIQSAELNGVPLPRARISHEQVRRGGELVYTMGPSPNEKWGSASLDLPPATFE